jgi:hypothetical protein
LLRRNDNIAAVRDAIVIADPAPDGLFPTE